MIDVIYLHLPAGLFCHFHTNPLIVCNGVQPESVVVDELRLHATIRYLFYLDVYLNFSGKNFVNQQR